MAVFLKSADYTYAPGAVSTGKITFAASVRPEKLSDILSVSYIDVNGGEIVLFDDSTSATYVPGTGVLTFTSVDTTLLTTGTIQALISNSVIGYFSDASNTDQTTSGSVISFLKGIIATLKSLVVLAAGENHIGEVSENTDIVSASTITVTASSAYAAGASIGGKISLLSALRVSGGKGRLDSVLLQDKSNNKFTANIIVFNADPSAATLTDNTAFVFSTDNTKVIRTIPIAASDWTTINGIAFCDLSVGKPIKATTGTTLYAAIINTSAPTFSATSDILMNLGLLRS